MERRVLQRPCIHEQVHARAPGEARRLEQAPRHRTLQRTRPGRHIQRSSHVSNMLKHMEQHGVNADVSFRLCTVHDNVCDTPPH